MSVDRLLIVRPGLWFVSLALLALALAGPASEQTKIAVSEQCGRPTSEYTIRVGDRRDRPGLLLLDRQRGSLSGELS